MCVGCDHSSTHGINSFCPWIQCPEVEPEISLYLRVCTACREALIGRQVRQRSGKEAVAGLDMLAELALLHIKFSVAEANVNSQLRDVSAASFVERGSGRGWGE